MNLISNIWNINNWPFKWYGLWNEYGIDYKNYPSIFNFVDVAKNKEYNKKSIIKYLSQGIIVASTSSMNFLSPFNGRFSNPTISFRTDGEWLWLDNISEFIENENLLIPEKWYNKMINNSFNISNDFTEEQTQLDWPNL